MQLCKVFVQSCKERIHLCKRSIQFCRAILFIRSIMESV
jgi:hypothetical protein